MLQHSGTFPSGTVKGTWFVVPDSGTGDSRGLRGEGSFVEHDSEQHTPFTFDYDFE